MKDQVVIINTARGGLIDTDALIEGIESGKIGAVGLDVVEKEFGLYYYDRKSDIIIRKLLYLVILIKVISNDSASESAKRFHNRASDTPRSNHPDRKVRKLTPLNSL